MGKISYYLVLIVIIGGILSAFWVYQKYFKEEKSPTLYFRIEKGNIQEVVRVRGEVVSQKEFDLEFPSSGIVERISVKEGQKVKEDEPLMKLETTDFELEIKQLEAKLSQSQANLEKLIAGPTKEDIKVLETKTANAQRNFEDTKTNLENVENKADTDLRSIYDSSLAAVQKSVSIAKTALLTLSDIQSAHFTDTLQESINLADEKAKAVESLLGAENAGRWATSGLSTLEGGTFGTVQNAVRNPTFENIDKALSETLDALQKVKSTLDAVPVTTEFTSTEKTNLSTEKSNISAEIITISGKQQAIEVQKVTNQNNITSAQISVNDAQSALELAQRELEFKRAGTRIEDIEIAKAQITELKSQIMIIQEKMKKSTLTSPTSGKIIKIWLEEKELFTPGQIAVSLFAFGYKIQADVSELEIRKVREIDGNDVSIKLDAFPNLEFQGKVFSIEPKEIIKEGDKYYRVNIYLEGEAVGVRSGMSADLEILISLKENVLKIPEFAVYQKNDKKFVKVLEENLQKEVEIETGISDGEFIEIIKGLSEGQTILVSTD